MSVSVSQVGSLPYYIVGAQKKTITDVALDSSYQSGGEPLPASSLRLNKVDYANAEIYSAATTTVNATSAGYDPTNALLHVYDETPAEVASTADLTGLVVRVTAYGT